MPLRGLQGSSDCQKRRGRGAGGGMLSECSLKFHCTFTVCQKRRGTGTMGDVLFMRSPHMVVKSLRKLNKNENTKDYESFGCRCQFYVLD